MNWIKNLLRLREDIWLEAFTAGYKRALKDDSKNLLQIAKEQVYSEAISDIDKIVNERISKLDNATLKSKKAISDKKKEIKLQLAEAIKINNKDNQLKYECYLETLNWELKDEA